VRTLLNIYTNQHLRVLRNGISSCNFSVKNGVKQGGIISPVLFCLYFDNVLAKLKSSQVSCYIANLYVGGLAYADDLVLLAPTAASMRRMLAICDDFARDFHVSFNAAKSKSMMFSPISANSRFSAPSPMFYIGNQVIENINQWLHLGHMLTNDLDDTADITRRCNSFTRQTNNLLCQFSTLDSLTINRLFTPFCSSHYGCELWNLQCPAIDDYYATWRIALRRVLAHTTKSSS
jgi:hypothetical protein